MNGVQERTVVDGLAEEGEGAGGAGALRKIRNLTCGNNDDGSHNHN